MKERKRWKVWRRTVIEIEDQPGGESTTAWQCMGLTMAVSEAQAVNNIRFRENGKRMYETEMFTNGRMLAYIEWKAVEE